MTFTHGHALIIGIGTYEHLEKEDIPCTAEDATAVADVLRNPDFCGYPDAQVTVLTHDEASRANVLAQLKRLSEQVDQDDTVFVFYSGHGRNGTDRKYHLTTYDTQCDQDQIVPGTAVSQHDLIEGFRAIRAQRLLFICNACFAGALSPVLGARQTRLNSTTLPRQTSAALLSTGSGRIIITSADEAQKAFTGDGLLSLFGQALVDGLQGKGLEIVNRQGFISVFDLYMHLYSTLEEWVPLRIPATSREYYRQQTQQPELTILKGLGPFAVALYPGATNSGPFHAPAQLESHTTVREIDPELSRRILVKLLEGQGVPEHNHSSAERDNFSNAQVGGNYTVDQRTRRQGTLEIGDNNRLGDLSLTSSGNSYKPGGAGNDSFQIGNIISNSGPVSIGRQTWFNTSSGTSERRQQQIMRVIEQVHSGDALPILKQTIVATIESIARLAMEQNRRHSREIAGLLNQLDQLVPMIAHELRLIYGWELKHDD